MGSPLELENITSTQENDSANNNPTNNSIISLILPGITAIIVATIAAIGGIIAARQKVNIILETKNNDRQETPSENQSQ